MTISQRVESAPSVIVTGRYGHSANMERIMRNQAMQDPSKLSMMMSQKTMEINPRHPIVAELNKRIKDDPEDSVRPNYAKWPLISHHSIADPPLTLSLCPLPLQSVKETAWLLYDTALLESGFAHDDVQNFTSRVLNAVRRYAHNPIITSPTHHHALLHLP